MRFLLSREWTERRLAVVDCELPSRAASGINDDLMGSWAHIGHRHVGAGRWLAPGTLSTNAADNDVGSSLMYDLEID